MSTPASNYFKIELEILEFWLNMTVDQFRGICETRAWNGEPAIRKEFNTMDDCANLVICAFGELHPGAAGFITFREIYSIARLLHRVFIYGDDILSMTGK